MAETGTTVSGWLGGSGKNDRPVSGKPPRFLDKARLLDEAQGVDKMRIYGLSGCNLGDVWASVNYALSDCLSHHVPLSRWSPEGFDRAPLLEEIASVLDEGDRLSIVSENRNFSPSFSDAFHCRFQLVRPEYRWQYPGNRYLAVQLRGSSGADLKNCSEDEISELEGLFCHYGVVTLGLPMTLTDSIRALSRCRVFLGIESGMAHVNHSVGAPALLLRNQCNEGMIGLHSCRPGTWVKDMGEALRLLTPLLTY